MTEKQLQAHYKKYNKKYFDGTLPAEVPVHLVNMEASDACGLTTRFADGALDLNVIYIDTNLVAHEVFQKFTLLHEMVHVKLHAIIPATADPHGQAFDEEMMRLAIRGAFHKLW